MADNRQPASRVALGHSKRHQRQPRSGPETTCLPQLPSRAPEPAPGAASDRLTVRISSLPPEVRDVLATAPNRAALVRDALVWYCRQGETLTRVVAGVGRLEAALEALAARLDRLEARLAEGTAVPNVAPARQLADIVARQAAALAAWCDD